MAVTSPDKTFRLDRRARESASGVDGDAGSGGFYNPFTSPTAGRSAAAGGGRMLANGASLAAVPPAGQTRIDAFARRSVSPVLVKPARIASVAASPPADTPPPPEPAPAAEPAPPPSASVAPSPDKPPRGGGGSSGSDGGSGGGRERTFDQDDVVAGVLAVLALLLLILFLWPRGATTPVDGDGLVTTQIAATPAPPPPASGPDPFGGGPVDLRPTSPPPAPVEVELPPPEPACPVSKRVRALFCTDSDELTLPARDALDDELAEWRSCIRDKAIVVTGYADTRGPKEYNVDLAARRARSIASILRSEGLSVAEAIGFGELPDIEDNRNCANQRRVDIGLKEAGVIPPSRECRPPTEMERIACD